MKKFEAKKIYGNVHYIGNGDDYLHSDGSVLSCCEYFPTEKQAQAVLDKFRPAPPPHVWVHGDVFRFDSGAIMIYIRLKSEAVIYCLRSSGSDSDRYHPIRAGDISYLSEGVFLFNIKAALSDRGLV